MSDRDNCRSSWKRTGRRLIACPFVGVACAMLHPGQPEGVMATLLLVAAFELFTWELGR